MTDPTNRFTGLAQIYASARPSYPEEAIQYIITTAGMIEGDLIIDVGAGTGISSRLFAERGFNVEALEPNEDMRRNAELAGTVYGAAQITYRDGTGENTGLEASSQKLVVSAQAFHWFRAEPALAEFLRVLKAGGWLALFWNERDERDALTKEYGDAIRLAPETGNVESQRFIAGKPLLEDRSYVNTHKMAFPNEQELDLAGFIGRAFSASYTPKEGPLSEEIRKRLTDAFHRYQQNGKVLMKYETSVYMGRKPI
jgi:ubiquinone/menaquinone biosynthesis C-methylase UbiE